MPYKRSYKRRPYRKVRNYKNAKQKTRQLVQGHGPTMLERLASGVGSVAKLAQAVAPAISMINTELKFNDINLSQAVTTAAPFMLNLNTITQGTDEINRIGNSILAKDLNIRYSLQGLFTTSPVQTIRMILVCDKQQAGSAFTANFLFQNPADPMRSLFNRDYSDRFVIMQDKYVTVQQNSQQDIYDKMYRKLDFHIRYVLPTGVAGALGNNSVYLYAYSDAAVNGPNLTVSSRLNFTDN